MVFFVLLIILKMTVKNTWLEITAVKVGAQNDTDKFVNSGIAEKDALERDLANISMKTPILTTVKL